MQQPRFKMRFLYKSKIHNRTFLRESQRQTKTTYRHKNNTFTITLDISKSNQHTNQQQTPLLGISFANLSMVNIQ